MKTKDKTIKIKKERELKRALLYAKVCFFIISAGLAVGLTTLVHAIG